MVNPGIIGAGGESTPVDEDGEEPEETRDPTFPQLLALNFQQLKNARFWRLWRVECLVSIWHLLRSAVSVVF